MKKYILPVLAAAAFSFSHFTIAGEDLFKGKICIACHAVESKLVGPSMKEVARKYADQEDSAETIAANIKNGSSGSWGPIPMPPNAVTEEEADQLAQWILDL